MAGLQRSAISFRRSGSSGLVWEDRFLSDDSNQKQKEEPEQEATATTLQDQADQKAESKDVNKPSKIIVGSIERSRSNGGGRAFRTGKVSPAIEPPSPRVSACGFCSAFGKPAKSHKKKPGKRRI